jgi:hypothetical protein
VDGGHRARPGAAGPREVRSGPLWLFHTDEDRSEAHDLAEQHPDKVKELVDLWMDEAKKFNVLPLNALTVFEFRDLEYYVPVPSSGQYTYYPGTTEVPEASAVNTHGVSYKILAEVEFTKDTEGVTFAQGSRFGGHALFVKDGKLTYAFKFLGIPREQKIVGDAPTSGTHIVGAEFTKERVGDYHESHGPLMVAEEQIRSQGGRYALSGEGLCTGYDGGDAVSSEYTPKFEFSGGEITKVVFDIADDTYVSVERHLAGAMARD